MANKTVKTVAASFMAGVLLTGGFWLGVENSAYFKDKTEVAAPSSALTQSAPASAAKPVLLESTNNNVISNMVKQVGPAVVKIETEAVEKQQASPQDQLFRQFFGGGSPFSQGEQTKQALGSGFIISKDGYILTNNHVIDGAQVIKVNITGTSKKYDAKVIGADPELDLAVLKINADKDLPTVKLGNSNQIQVGDWAVAIGNPYGLDHTVTVGVISAKGRPLDIGQAKFKDLLQTDASINPGNSGGPLLNLQGEVIGINTAINAEAQGIGFAIPINTVQQVLDDLIHKGKVSRPWLGVAVQDMTPELAKYFNIDMKNGAVVGYIASGSPAEKAGIQQGDIIIEMDKKKVTNSQELVNAIGTTKIGEKHEFLILRDGQMKTVSVIIGEKNYQQPQQQQ
jgi:serine protease Do